MQSVKPIFLLVLLTYILLACAPHKATPTTSGGGKTSKCGAIPVGVTTETHDLELAGATLKEFSLGKWETKVTSEFLRIVSETAMDENSRIKAACVAIQMAGADGNPEMVAYFVQMQSFLSTNPNIYDRIKWIHAYPFPNNSAARKPTDTSPDKAAVRQLVEDGYTLKGSVEGDYRSQRKQNTFLANQDALLRTWRKRVSIWEDSVAATLQQIDPIFRAQFQNYRGGASPRLGENTVWSDLDGALNDKLNFLIQVMNRL